MAAPWWNTNPCDDASLLRRSVRARSDAVWFLCLSGRLDPTYIPRLSPAVKSLESERRSCLSDLEEGYTHSWLIVELEEGAARLYSCL